jgi:Secretion system C-terminal sorting domain/SusE outer membrane protein
MKLHSIILLVSFFFGFNLSGKTQGTSLNLHNSDPQVAAYGQGIKNFNQMTLSPKEMDRIKSLQSNRPVYSPSYWSQFKAPLLFEDFQLGMPANWIRLDIDLNTPNAAVAYVGPHWTVRENFDEVGDSVAVSTSWFTPPGVANDWLITPEIIIGTGVFVQWDAKAQDPSFPDGYEVRISTNGGATVPDFMANPALFSIAAEIPSWTSRSVDLDLAGYTNDTIRIAFRNNSNDQFLLLLDDIFVGSFTDTLSAFNLNGPTSGSTFNIAGNYNDSIYFDWAASSSTGGFAINYTFWVDSMGGNFNPPLDTSLVGIDTFSSVTYMELDQFLSGLGIAIGDSIELSWTVSAETVGDTIFATTPFNATLIRGVVNLPPDFICGATTMILDTIHVGDNTGATVDPGEPVGTCWTDFGGASADNTIWYVFVAPISSNYQTSTDFTTPNNDTQLAAYTSSGGCTGLLTEIACNDDIDVAGGNFLSEISFFANAGDTIYIQVDGWTGTQGVFNIQTTLVITYQYDIELDLSTVLLNGPFDYASIISSNYPDFSTSAVLRNVGLDTVTIATLSADLNPGSLSVSGSTPFVAPGDSATITTTTIPLAGGTLYNIDVVASINEADGDTTNNGVSGPATSAVSSDSVFARELESSSNGSLGAPFEVWLANSYTLTDPDTLTSVTINFGTAVPGRDFEINIIDYSNGIGTNILYNSGSITSIPGAGFFTVAVSPALILTPGTYLVAIHQTSATVNVGGGTTTNIFRPNSSFIGFTPLGNWVDLITQFNRTYLIRANFGPPPPPSISRINLLSPINGQVVAVEGSSNTPFVFDWEDASTNTGGAITYEFLMDNPGGDFSAPVFNSPSDNSSTDSKFTLDMGLLNTLLINLGASTGDTVSYIWQARASASGIDSLAVVEFDVTFILGVLGLDKAFYDRSISIFPNPAQNKVTIEVDNDRVKSLEIVNSIGESLISMEWNSERKKTIDVSKLGSGIYFVKFQTLDGSYSQKLILN